MNSKKLLCCLTGLCLGLFSLLAQARSEDCRKSLRPETAFVEIPSIDLGAQPPAPLVVKGKLSLPLRFDRRKRCFVVGTALPAVVILHGSAGVDSRGDFYARGLNAAGVATLEIDMWEARGVTGPQNRPRAPILTFADAFAALGYLSAHPNVAPGRIGVLGFSWGGVVSLAAAETLYATNFGKGLHFAAHVANYPVCYGANAVIPGLPPPAEFGSQLLHLTGAPVLIQIGSEDDYDNGAGHCRTLADGLNGSNNNVVQVTEYPGAYHAWDRLMIPVTAQDPFGNEGSYFRSGVIPTVRIAPDVDQAYASRRRVVEFFRRKL
ncbi:MAG: dienelactone hydrolase family protein [Rhodocyclaceae bacterium]|nr:dienelactone hydrolase family protein [Rhodocyclaceae bacterium]MCP5233028.1 dienelactone hydrolase family protein [Zoogloeaceae bacterium]MCB1912508.1 dienelactone hydrolase family protein [Rhodocyclaceae bacterium]MCP5239789.1 dienelactone hydrolase family protein [Zoogloeaceae bacterium]MCP5253974.1 dienelactone hydrolase family protein [Zoogloeaceae bacterium]